jgi:LemA protein
MKLRNIILLSFAAFFVTTAFLIGMSISGTYNGYQTSLLKSNEANAEVLNQYQRRADLIPNLIKIVEKAAGNENKTLRDVIEARSKLGSIQLTPETLKDPEAMKQFSRYQGDITTALSKMMMLKESYPELKTNQNFLDAQSQLEGTENRIAVARNRAIKAVTVTNSTIIKFPSNIYAGWFGLTQLPQFIVDDVKAISIAPRIE